MAGRKYTSLSYQGQSLDLKARFKALSWLNRTVTLVSIAFCAFLGGFETIYGCSNLTLPTTYLAYLALCILAIHLFLI